MTVAGGGAGFHGGGTAHAAVLFVELSIDFHDLAGGFGATGQEAAADHGVGEREGFDDVAALRDAAIGDDADAGGLGGLAADVEGGQLRDADAGDDAGGADGAGALADFDGIGAAMGEVLDGGGAGDVAGDDGKIGVSGADEADGFADALAEAVGGGDGDDIDAAFHQGADVVDDTDVVELARRVAGGGDGGAADEAELGVAAGLERGGFFLGDALDVAEGEEAAEAVFVVDDQELVDAEVLVEELVGPGDRIGLEFALGDGLDIGAGHHGLADLAGGVPGADYVAGEEAEEVVFFIDDGEGAEREVAFLDEGEDIADEVIRGDFDGLLDEAVDVVFDAGDFRELLALGHIVMDEAEAAVEGHGDGHPGLGDGIHVRGDDGDLEMKALRESGLERGVAGEDFRVLRGKSDVVVGEGDALLGGEKGVGGLIEGVVNGRGRGRGGCHGLSWEAKPVVASQRRGKLELESASLAETGFRRGLRLNLFEERATIRSDGYTQPPRAESPAARSTGFQPCEPVKPSAA